MSAARQTETALNIVTGIQNALESGGWTFDSTNEWEQFKGTGYLVGDARCETRVKVNRYCYTSVMVVLMKVYEHSCYNNLGRQLLGLWYDETTGEIVIDSPILLEDREYALDVARVSNEKAIGHIVDGEYQGDVKVEIPA